VVSNARIFGDIGQKIMGSAMSKTLYLHIGASKTGSSALQYFLLKNRDLLSSKGINYPEHLVNINQFSSGNAKWIYDCRKRGDISKIKSNIDDLFNSDHASVILSSEYLYELKEEHIAKLKNVLTHIDVKIIVYLRRQDNWLMSAYQQHIKMWGQKSTIDIWSKKHHDSDRYWYKPIHVWAHHFGKENVIVRPYEARQFSGGNIFSDFLNILCLDLDDGFEIPQKKVNTSYRADALEAMRLLNSVPLSKSSKLQLRTLLQRYSEHLGKEGDWPYSLLSPSEQLQCAKHYIQGNQAIARGYLGRDDGQLFYDSLPNPDEPWKCYPGLSEENIQEISDFILKHDVKTSIRIKKAVLKTLKSNEPAVREVAQKLSPGFVIYAGKYITLRDYVDYYTCPAFNLYRFLSGLFRSCARAGRRAMMRHGQQSCNNTDRHET
jgi:hypothetical protein